MIHGTRRNQAPGLAFNVRGLHRRDMELVREQIADLLTGEGSGLAEVTGSREAPGEPDQIVSPSAPSFLCTVWQSTPRCARSSMYAAGQGRSVSRLSNCFRARSRVKSSARSRLVV